MPKIKVSLNSASVADAVLQAQKYAKKVDGLGQEIVHAVVESGVEEAKNMAMYMNAYDSGELVNSIIGEVEENKGKVLATAEHAAFVEMGTGIRGEENPNPNNYLSGWVYDVHKHGDKGWFYYGDDGKKHWTKGMPARPFMYDSAQILRQSVPFIAEDLMKKE